MLTPFPTLFIFDLDGTMLNNEILYVRHWGECMAAAGYPITDEFTIALVGSGEGAIRQKHVEKFGPGFDYDGLRRSFSVSWRAFVQHNPPALKPGILELLGYLKSLPVKLAVGTATPQGGAVPSMQRAGLLPYFDVVVCGDAVAHSKPAPDIFLRAAELAGEDPKNCLVVEDSPHGIAAAHAAGMRSFLVPDIVKPNEDALQKATRQYASLVEVLEDLRQE